MRAVSFVFVGVFLGVAAGYILTFLAMNVIAPLMGNTDEMSSGLIGTFTAVFSIPILALVGGVLGYRRFAAERDAVAGKNR